MKAKNNKAFEMQHKQQSQLVTSLQPTLIILLVLQQGAFFCAQLENVNHFLRKNFPCDLHLKMGSVRGIGGFWSENKVSHRPSPTRKVSLIANNIFLELDRLHKCIGRIYIEKLTAYCGVFYMENSGNLKASKINELFEPGFLLMMDVHIDLFNLL